MEKRPLACRKANAHAVAHKADVRDVCRVNAARCDRHGICKRCILTADKVAAEILHRHTPLIRHRRKRQNIDRVLIRLSRKRFEQCVQFFARLHRILVRSERHNRNARKPDHVTQAQCVAVFEVDRPDDVGRSLLGLPGMIARHGLESCVGLFGQKCLVDLQELAAFTRHGCHLAVIHKRKKGFLSIFLPAVIDKQKRGRCPSVQLILARVLHDLRLAEKRRAALRLKAQHQAKLFPLRIVEKLRALRVNDLPAAGKAHRRQGSCQHRCQ